MYANLFPNEPILMPYQATPANGDIHLCEKFIELRDRFEIKTAIELGTCVGGTTRWLADNFENVIGIELLKEYLSIAKKRVGNRKNVVFFQGSTVDVLPKVLGSLDVLPEGQIIFHVDSHWGPNNPLLQELAIIAQYGLKPIIEIHDFKNPLHTEFGFDTYGAIVYEWNYIKDSIEKIYGIDGYIVEYNSKATGAMRGCIFIYPKTSIGYAYDESGLKIE